jgi:ribosomal protein S12 methylthiotransferase
MVSAGGSFPGGYVNKKRYDRRGAKRPFRFCILSLGCAKNTVDSNGMAVLLKRAGYYATDDPALADYVIVNTCGFIHPAREESLETLQALADSLKTSQKLIAAGCWAQRQPDVLLEKVPHLDAVLGARTWTDIVPLLQHLSSGQVKSTQVLVEEQLTAMPEDADAPGYAISGRSAFLKIADGCNRSCAFCAIPAIKGRHVSRTMEAILHDAQQLQARGIQEINLIAQDTTYYGYDFGLRDGLAQLLESMVKEIPEVPWIRVLYAFPGFVTPRLIDTITHHPQILPYIDIPLQHAHPGVLRRMRRPDDVDEVRLTIKNLRESMPDIAIRTTLIVGFPGETEAEFQVLMGFVKEMQFDRVGVFAYSHEDGTNAGSMDDDVPSDVKHARREALMLAQQDISLAKNRRLIGYRMPVLLEGVGDDLTVGRSYRDAPEIDGMVLIRDILEPGQMVTVEVTDAGVYDLVAKVVNDS